MSHHSPAFSHAVDPLDVDDWLKIIGKKLDITQCNDQEKVLYASGRLEVSRPIGGMPSPRHMLMLMP
jgi:hypothetical protein